MADTKITALTAITTVDPANDVLPIVDVSDTSMAASGTTKKITTNQLLGASGTATLASATITGDLTVDTNTLKVDSANNRVGIGTASPADYLEVVGNGANGIRVSRSGLPTQYTTLSAGATGPSLDVSAAIGALSFGIGGSTAMTLNATGLGVGTIPGGSTGSSKIAVVGGATYDGNFDIIANFTNSTASAAKGVLLGYNNSTNNGIISAAYGSGTEGLTFWTHNGSSWGQRMELTATGNVGIGVTPSAWNSAYRAIEIAKTGNAIFSNNASNNNILFTQNAYYDGSWKYGYTALAAHYEIQNGAHKWNTAASGTAGNAITWTQAMTLDANGILLIGTTNNVIWNTTNQGCVVGGNAVQASRSNDVSLLLNRIGSNGKIAAFAREGLEVGDISVTTTGTTFNSTSDYRLKEDVQPLVGGLARVSALKPSIYKWKSNGSSGEGFLAHELAEVVPAAVSGEKDAVNEDGSIKAQSVDMSRVVPILVAAIKELAAEVNALKNS